LEFGKFTLDPARAATWLGWTTSPSGTSSMGHVENGKAILHTAPNGKLGVMWSSDSDHVCYVESSDAGQTWTTNYHELYQAPTNAINASDGKTYDCTFSGCNGMDFSYDQTSTPTFMWQAYWNSASGTFFPLNSTGIFTWKMGSNTVTIPVVFNDPAITDLVMFDSINATVNTINVVDYFTASDAPDVPHQTTIWNPTVISSSNPNKWGIVYETFQDGDVLTFDVFDDQTATAVRLYRSLYFMKTTDGGANWTTPEQYAANDPASDPSVKIDYHFPSVPSLSDESVGSNIVSDVIFAADTCPGPVVTGQAVWDDNTWFHKSVALAAVRSTKSADNLSLSQNYPNPFASSTTIPIVMKNDDMVTVSVTDILGREVAMIYHGRLSAGEHRISCNSAGLEAGVYTYTIKTSTGALSGRMSLIK
ncbi:MAG: T9SS type A sorting domain-containing protein, partial [Ignavibacteriota bacterium]